MKDVLIQQAMPLLVQAVEIVVGAVFAWLLVQVKAWVTTQAKKAAATHGAESYAYGLRVAQDVAMAVEQIFRKDFAATADQKRLKFEEMIRAQIPEITQADIDHFREAAVGGLNAFATTVKDAAASPVTPPVDEPKE